MKIALVSAVGGDLGLSIARIVKSAGYRVVGADCRADYAAAHLGVLDARGTLPSADRPDYAEALIGLLREHRADAFIPACEPELRLLADGSLREAVEAQARLIAAPAKLLRIWLDKLATAEALKSWGLPAPWTLSAAESQPPRYPCVIKDRRGSGSRGFAVLRSEEDWRRARREDAVLQELLEPSGAEYTCGVFRSRGREMRTVILKRELRGDLTWSAEVVEDGAIEDLCAAIMEASGLIGSANVQLVKTAKGPVPFEINPRFSSTVSFRHAIGFQDVLWSLADSEGSAPPPFAPPVGARLYRYVEDVPVFANRSALRT